MSNFLEIQQRAIKLTPQKITTDLFKFIKSIEEDIFYLNVQQLEEGKTPEGKKLINSNRLFSGRYTERTEEIAREVGARKPKKAGELYNFDWGGDFILNFKLDLFDDRVELYSTGEGNGLKKVFFEEYNSLYGLTKESISEIINERIEPFVLEYFRKNLIQ